MKLRNTLIKVIIALIPLGQPIQVITFSALTTASLILSSPNIAKADDAISYLKRGNEKYNKGDYSGAIAEFTKAIEINPSYANAYRNRGTSKKNLGDLKGACSDWRKASSLGNQDAAKSVRNKC